MVKGIFENKKVNPLRYSGRSNSSNLSATKEEGASINAIARQVFIKVPMILKSVKIYPDFRLLLLPSSCTSSSGFFSSGTNKIIQIETINNPVAITAKVTKNPNHLKIKLLLTRHTIGPIPIAAWILPIPF